MKLLLWSGEELQNDGTVYASVPGVESTCDSCSVELETEIVRCGVVLP